MEKVLGLDLGTNSIGFALNEIEEKDGIVIFNELSSNSIIFSEYMNAEDRRNFRDVNFVWASCSFTLFLKFPPISEYIFIQRQGRDLY